MPNSFAVKICWAYLFCYLVYVDLNYYVFFSSTKIKIFQVQVDFAWSNLIFLFFCFRVYLENLTKNKKRLSRKSRQKLGRRLYRPGLATPTKTVWRKNALLCPKYVGCIFSGQSWLPHFFKLNKLSINFLQTNWIKMH